MTTFATITTILSLLLFGGFIGLSIVKFTLLGSYSAYAAEWERAVPMNHMNLWSVVTMTVAFLLCFAMLEVGDESPLQFLGFAAPVYLGVVSLTPKWATDKHQKKVHVIGALTCALAAVLWLIFTLRQWYLIPISLLLAWCGGYFTYSLKTSYVFWLEMAMFFAVYVAVLFRF